MKQIILFNNRAEHQNNYPFLFNRLTSQKWQTFAHSHTHTQRANLVSLFRMTLFILNKSFAVNFSMEKCERKLLKCLYCDNNKKATKVSATTSSLHFVLLLMCFYQRLTVEWQNESDNENNILNFRRTGIPIHALWNGIPWKVLSTR